MTALTHACAAVVLQSTLESINLLTEEDVFACYQQAMQDFEVGPCEETADAAAIAYAIWHEVFMGEEADRQSIANKMRRKRVQLGFEMALLRKKLEGYAHA